MFAFSQGSKIGVRAGLNYSWFNGPKEEGESFTTSNGFHFGINYSYYFSPYFGIRGEILYTQKGNTQNYVGDSYYILRRGAERILDFGSVKEYKLEDSNAYVSLPISASVQITKRFEVFGGMSFDFLVGPRGTGILDYESNINIEDEHEVFFIQSFENNYYGDEATTTPQFSNLTTALFYEGDLLVIPRAVAAYYFVDEKEGNKYNWFDVGLHAGANYFLNKGFYIGLSFNYGLIDPTRTEMDFSLREVTNDNTFTDEDFIRRDDNDHQISMQASVGFRF